MKGNKLTIIYKDASGAEKTRCYVDKWTFQDRAMSIGSQFITFGIVSEKPIPFAVGDYCVYRGQSYYLNSLPSVSQTAKPNTTGDAFKYENVKFESASADLGRVMMLDVTPTTGDYVAAVGTNYTGSSNFQLFCGETKADVLGKIVTYTPVCTLAGKIQANLDRAFPNDGWKIHVNLSATKLSNGISQLVTHTDDKVLSFNNTTVAVALSEVNNTFKLDYFVKGREIYIGYTLGAITGSNTDVNEESADNDYFYFGYGKGYADKDHQGKALFEIKKTANANQQIITRLRAMGSTKNMPYRYYNKKYNLSQSLFPQNLQLPDTFETPEVKGQHNTARKQSNPFLRSVLGDTNDAYIDKNDDCMTSTEGLREGSAQWDGSNPDLEEIYPTIREATYGELRGADCKDIDGYSESNGTTPDTSGHKSFLNYRDLERIDEILAVGYLTNERTIVDDANIGNGIMPQEGANNYPHQDFDAVIQQTSIPGSSMTLQSDGLLGLGEHTLFTVSDQNAGSYFMAASFGHIWTGAKLSTTKIESCTFGYRIKVYVKPKSASSESLAGTYTEKDYKVIKRNDDAFVEFELPSLPDVSGNESQIKNITLTEVSDVRVTFELLVENNSAQTRDFSITYFVGNSKNKPDTAIDYKSQYRWAETQYADYFPNTPFHVIIKDLGLQDFRAQFNGKDKPMLVMSDGHCVAREFEIGDDVKKVVFVKNGKRYKGWQLSLTRSTDTSLHTFYPSATDKVLAEDHYVLTGIEMPEVYIKAAEIRLLTAATQYLSENDETKYTYEPHLDDIYLTRNYDKCEEKGDVSKSVYWNLYAGLKFPFLGIPETSNAAEILPIANITIESVTIKEGDGLTPKVEMTLNDKIEQTTYNKITTAIDKIYNGSLFSQMGVGNGISTSDVAMLIKRLGDERFLSKVHDDSTPHTLTAGGLVSEGGAKVGGDMDVRGESRTSGVANTGDITNTGDIHSAGFERGLLDGTGYGIYKDETGKTVMEIDKLLVRLKAIFAELEIRKMSYVGGDMVHSSAGSVIVRVEPVDAQGNVLRDKLVYPVSGGGFIPSNGGVLTYTEEAHLEDTAAYRCYILADDGTTRTMNDWRVGDQAKCKTFNIQPGVYKGVSNRDFWRLVVRTGTETLEDGKTYNFVDLSDTKGTLTVTDENGTEHVCVGMDTSIENDVPAAQDSIVQLGSQTDPSRQYAYIIYVSEHKRVDYTGINDYDLSGHESEKHSADGGFIKSDNFEIMGWDGTVTPLVVERGAWVEGQPYGHYDHVSHGGSTWLCIVGKGQTTTEEPVDGSTVWLKEVEQGQEPLLMSVFTDGEGQFLRNGQGEITLTAVVTRGGEDLTASYPQEAFSWTRDSGNAEWDAAWNARHERYGSTCRVTAEDVFKKAVFNCILEN